MGPVAFICSQYTTSCLTGTNFCCKKSFFSNQASRCGLKRCPRMNLDGGISLDPLSTFTELVWRSQEQICRDTAACDGLGTYNDADTPSLIAQCRTQGLFPRRQRQKMLGGRAFDQAFADVWMSRARDGNGNRRRAGTRSRILTILHKDSGEVKRIVEGAGLAIRLKPRSVLTPTLRATAYFFQAGNADSGTWWFNGSVDLCRPAGMSLNEFSGDARKLLLRFDQICSVRRSKKAQNALAARASFLESCLRKGSLDTRGAGNSGLDQIAGFGFVGACLEALLPTYLPLLTSKRRHSWIPGEETGFAEVLQRNEEQLMSREAGARAVEHAERIALDGGAVLESTVVEGSPFVLWRFNVTPAALSPAGRMYDALRRDAPSVTQPCVYL